MTCETSKLLDAIYNHSNDIIITLSAQACVLTSNKKAEEFFSQQSKLILNENFFTFCEKNHIEFPITDFNAVLFKKHQIKFLGNVKISNKDRKISWSISALENSMGTSDTILIIGHDITAYIEENNANKNVSSYLETIIHNVPHTIFWKDKNSVYLGCNKAFSDGAGLSSPKEIVGKTDYDLPWAKSETDAYIEDDKEVMRTRTPKLNIEEPQTSPDGEKIILLTSKVPLLDEQNGVIGVLGIYTDITERKQKELELKKAKEKAELASRMKAEFTANMGHDIRTPLTGMIGAADAIEHLVTDPEAKEYAHDILAASRRLLNLLNEILEITQLDLNRKSTKTIVFDLQEIIVSLEELLKPSFREKSIKFTIDYDIHLPKIFDGKAIFIHRILLNLLGNALKFTTVGEIKLTVSLLETNKGIAKVRFVVADTGVGIPSDKFNIIFEPFTRLNSSYDGVYSGTGLGLYIVKQLVEMLEGHIDVQSTVGKGTRFTITLSLKKTKQKNLSKKRTHSVETLSDLIKKNLQPVKEIPSSISSVENSYSPRILIVEDDSLVRKVFRLQLSSLDCQIEVATCGKDALKKLTENKFDLIYMDIGLPDFDGFEVTQRFRAFEKEHNKPHTPIIALTAHVDKKMEKQCLDAGIDAMEQKPLTNEIAKQHIKDFINQHHSANKQDSKSDFLAKELTDLLREQLPSNFLAIQTAYEIQDWEQLKFLVHKLHGALCYCNIPKARAAAKALEAALRGNIKGSELTKFYDAFCFEINRQLKS